MKIYEKLPQFEPPRELEPGEIDMLLETAIWPAATYFWGESYRDPEALEENEDVAQFFESGDANPADGKPDMVELRFWVEEEFPLNKYGEVDDGSAPDLYVGVALESYHHDLTGLFQNKFGCEEEIWGVVEYEFAWDGTPPLANHYYVYKRDEEDVESDRLDHRHRDFLKEISGKKLFNPDRNAELNTQDAIDIRNILLALETPAEIIAPTWEE
jgi:hypothetical protein